MSLVPTLVEEKRLGAQGYRLIAGIDEVGRGPLAGPVVAAAVILPLKPRPSWLRLVRDSKLLTPRKREYVFHCMEDDGASFAAGVIPHDVIDSRGIVTATRLAMRYAVEQLPSSPDFLLIDFVRLPELNLPQKSITRGDRLSVSIAAASVVAKVVRDRIMVEMDGLFPGYGLARNKGYGTSEHLAMLKRLGPCPIHRRTFAPVRALDRLL